MKCARASRHLAEILPRNTTLHKLYLGYNDIRDDGVYALIGAMRPRGQLEVIVNGNTHVSDQALTRLDRALDQVRSLLSKRFGAFQSTKRREGKGEKVW